MKKTLREELILTPEEARNISVEILGMDCVRKIGEENPIIGYKIGQVQKATAEAQLSRCFSLLCQRIKAKALTDEQLHAIMLTFEDGEGWFSCNTKVAAAQLAAVLKELE